MMMVNHGNATFEVQTLDDAVRIEIKSNNDLLVSFDLLPQAAQQMAVKLLNASENVQGAQQGRMMGENKRRRAYAERILGPVVVEELTLEAEQHNWHVVAYNFRRVAIILQSSGKPLRRDGNFIADPLPM